MLKGDPEYEHFDGGQLGRLAAGSPANKVRWAGLSSSASRQVTSQAISRNAQPVRAKNAGRGETPPGLAGCQQDHMDL